MRSRCLPKTPDRERTVAALQKELESVNDPEMLAGAGVDLIVSGRCNAPETRLFGMKLIRKALALDPSLINRDNLQDLLKSSQ